MSNIIPHFCHVRTVTVNEKGRLLCSCKHFERCAYPCRHQAAVTQVKDSDYPGFSHHDCGVQWWKKNVHHGLRGKEETSQLDGELMQLLQLDVLGPKASPHIMRMVWDSSQPRRVNRDKTQDDFSRQFDENEAIRMCSNFSSTSLQWSLKIFTSIIDQKTGNRTFINNVGFLTQKKPPR